MATLWDHQPPRAALVEIARRLHARGWMPGTAGNLSVRPEGAESFWITASGHPKGQLTTDDFVRVAIADGQVVETCNPENKPSAETSIHQVIYRQFPRARAALHVHSVTAVIAVERHAPSPATELALPPLEMLKGMGIGDENPLIHLAIFENWLDVPAIARQIAQRFSAQPPALTALMIRRHGVTVWGDSLQQAYDRLEVVDYLCDYLARL
ncbi:MAG: methylthioribulose 1-phosphate dehydratase [Pseudomonadota bacterium]